MFIFKNVLIIIFSLQSLKLNDTQNNMLQRCCDTRVIKTNNRYQVRFLTIILNNLNIITQH